MLDVLHYFFEEDLKHSTQLEVDSQTLARENIYKNLYGMSYPYATVRPQSNEGDNRPNNNVVKLDSASGSSQFELDASADEDLSDIKPFNPKRKEVKPYVPPTRFDGTSSNPFGDLLDSPMN